MSRTTSGMQGKRTFSMGNFDPKEAIENIVGSIDRLNKLDVYRVLDENSEDATDIADFIKEERPDLEGEVGRVMNIYGAGWN